MLPYDCASTLRHVLCGLRLLSQNVIDQVCYKGIAVSVLEVDSCKNKLLADSVLGIVPLPTLSQPFS